MKKYLQYAAVVAALIYPALAYAQDDNNDDETPDIRTTDELYVIGYLADEFQCPYEGNRNYFADYALTKVGDGQFKGSFYFPEVSPSENKRGEAQFRFSAGLHGWNPTYQVGSVLPDFAVVPVVFDGSASTYNGSVVPGGCGFWCLLNSESDNSWRGHWIKVSVDLYAETISMSLVSSGIDQVGDDMLTDTAVTEYYTLDGKRISLPQKGLVIRETGGKTDKVLIR